jgi:glycerol-3-phosphate O-acyltransferase
MLERWGLLGRMLSRIFFAPVFFPSESVELIRKAAEMGTVVYVMRMRSTLDFIYFNYAFLAHRLPLARFANGLRIWFWLPVREALSRLFGMKSRRKGVEVLRLLTRARRSSALFLQSRPWIVPPAEFKGPYLKTLIELQKEQQRPIILVPLTVIWGRQPVRPPTSPRGLFDPLMGDIDEPRIFRRVWQVLRYARRSLALACEPINLKAFVDQQASAADPVQTLERSVLDRIDAERRLRIGPRRAHPIEIRDQILESPVIQETIKRRAMSTGQREARVRRQAARELKRMQAVMTAWGLLRVAWINRRIWKRVFSGFEVDEAGMNRLMQAGKRGPLVFLPTHRSHVDYLVLSHLCFARDIVPPLIAAGMNLSFFPLGWIFRTAGAFFIKRQIGGDELYPELLAAYLSTMLKEGYNIEIFIEGTRTRTGRVLPPKLGLLSVVADLVASGDVPAAHVVPVSIGYERLAEINAVTRELTGGQKQAETLGGVLRAASVFWSRYGYINVQIGEPIEVRSFLASRGYSVKDTPPEIRRRAIRSLGFHNNAAASSITAVTPTSLCASGLLVPTTRGVQRDSLKRAILVLGQAARVGGARFVQSMWPDENRPLDDAGIDYALELLTRDRSVSTVGQREAQVHVVEGQARIRLEYYKNQVLQHLLGISAMAMVLRSLHAHQNGEAIDRPSLLDSCRFISNLMHLHYVHHAGKDIDMLIEQTEMHLHQMKLLESATDDAVRINSERLDDLGILASPLESTIEGHGAAVRAMLVLRSGPRPRKELEREILNQLHQWHLTGAIRRYESCQVPVVRIAIDWLVEEGLLMLGGDGASSEVRLSRQHRDGRALEVLAQRIERLLPHDDRRADPSFSSS